MQLPANKVPTGMAITNTSEYALVTVAAVPPGLAMGGRTRQRSVVDDTPSRERDARMLAGDGNPDPGVIL